MIKVVLFVKVLVLVIMIKMAISVTRTMNKTERILKQIDSIQNIKNNHITGKYYEYKRITTIQ